MFKIISRYNSGKYEGTFEVIDSADDREKASTFLKFGFFKKLIPVYIFIIVKERKNIS